MVRGEICFYLCAGGWVPEPKGGQAGEHQVAVGERAGDGGQEGGQAGGFRIAGTGAVEDLDCAAAPDGEQAGGAALHVVGEFELVDGAATLAAEKDVHGLQAAQGFHP